MLGFTRREHLLALGVFAVLTLLFFFPLLRGDTFSDVAGRQQQVYPWAGALIPEPDLPLLHSDQDDSVYPWQVFMNRELRDGRFPLWNPYSFGGAPFFANGQSGVLYPPRLVLAYTVSPARVHDLLLVTHLFGAGVAMFLLLGFVGVSFRAALVGGVAWMLNSFALSWQALEHYVAIEVWLPIGVLLAHALVRHRSWGATCALALVVGLLFTGGNVLFVELAAVAIFGYAISLAIADAKRDWRRLRSTAARVATALMLSAGLAAVLILPTSALAADSARIALSYSELDPFALSWSDLMYVFRPPPDPTKLDPYHDDLFAGTAVGVLALFGLIRRGFVARFAAVLAVLALLFMLHTPVTWLVGQLLPGFGNFKPLGRAAFVFQFALAILAALGLEAALRGPATLRRRMWKMPRRRGSAGRPRWLLLVQFAIPSAAGPIALLSVVVVSIIAQGWLWKRDVMLHQPATARHLYPETPLIRELRIRDGRFLPTFPTFRGSTAMISEVRSVGGYESLLPARIQDFWRVLGDRLAPTAVAAEPLIYAYHPGFELARVQSGLLARASVSHVVAAPAEVTPAPIPRGLRLEYGGSDGRIFGVTGALPETYVVGGCEVASSARAALERFISDDFDPTGKVIVEQKFLARAGLSCAGSSSGPAGSASIIRRSTNSLLVFAHARRPAWLVLADSWDEGWNVTVDGRAADVLPANSALRAVRLEPGEHTVRFDYDPPLFVLGVTISSLSLGIALGGFVLALRRRRGAIRTLPLTGGCTKGAHRESG